MLLLPTEVVTVTPHGAGSEIERLHVDLRGADVINEMPLYMYANSSGPLPGHSGVAGENGTCASCHASGAASVKTKGGSVAINFGSSQTYVPGQVQHWIVTVMDPSARRWEFEVTARQRFCNG